MDCKNIEEYSDFVDGMLSEPSKNLDRLVERLQILNAVEGYSIPGLMTGSTGLVCEAAELKDIVKKILYQGKELTPELLEHMKKELGDVAFYFVVLCQALGTSPSEVIELNVAKLTRRFGGNEFSIEKSEIRSEGDV